MLESGRSAIHLNSANVSDALCEALVYAVQGAQINQT